MFGKAEVCGERRLGLVCTLTQTIEAARPISFHTWSLPGFAAETPFRLEKTTSLNARSTQSVRSKGTLMFKLSSPHTALLDDPTLSSRSSALNTACRGLLLCLATSLLFLPFPQLVGCAGSSDDGVCEVTNEDCGPGACDSFADDEEDMVPGAACISCHSPGNLEDEDRDEDEDEDELFTVAGTVFATSLGGGGVSGVTVRVTDAGGAVIEMSSNSAGNFFTSEAITFPVTAEVERGGEVLEMAASVESADCNTCHSCGGSAGAKLFAP